MHRLPPGLRWLEALGILSRGVEVLFAKQLKKHCELTQVPQLAVREIFF